MPDATPVRAQIGARVRQIRRRRGLSQDVIAGRAGISKPYLSRLESGQREFNKRGLVEDLAEALGCSPADLTGAATPTPDRRALDAATAVPALMVALHDCTFDDVPDIPHRPVPELVRLAVQAAAEADDAQYAGSGSQLGDLLTELQVAAVTGPDKQAALEGLVHASIAAAYLAAALRHDELASTAALRGWTAAMRAERPDMAGMLVVERALTLTRIGGRRRAAGLVDATIADLTTLPGPARGRTAVAQAVGMLHLTGAHLSAKDGATAIDAHLEEAESLARYTGESNHMRMHFGPANVAAWRLAVEVETGAGPAAAESVGDDVLAALVSKDRRAAVHFDLARGLTQDRSGARDELALQHLDAADRLAPIRVRQDPIARELVLALDRRARRRAWVLSSMRRRVGLA